MADIKPFYAVRPQAELAKRIAALPYDVYNRKEAKEETLREPMSFLKIDRAETQMSDDTDTYDPSVYDKAREIYELMKAEKSFLKDDKECYYIYTLTMNGRKQTGIVACASIDDYENGIIKKHENTRAEKEADRINHVDRLNAQTGPIFLAYRGTKAIDFVTDHAMINDPLYDFTSPDGVRHQVWRIVDPDETGAISRAFKKIDDIYIADGHHRAASAVKVGLKRRAEHPGYTGKEEFNYFLSVLFPDHELKIMDYNRVVTDLNGLTENDFLDKVKEIFDVENISKEEASPASPHSFGMYLSGKWYHLKVRVRDLQEDPVDGLDVSLLQNMLLDPVLGIKDPKTDDRIDFVGGIRGIDELERRCASDCAVAFAMYPTSISELFAVADAGRLMPPKSTWFEPKLRSGLLIHEIG